MGRKSEEFRTEARRLEERAETAADETTRLVLMSAARRWRELARDVECYEVDATPATSGRDEQNRAAAIAALSRAVRAYWDHEKARPLSDRLAELAASLDEVCGTKPAAAESSAHLKESPSPNLSDGSFGTSVGLTQVKDDTR